MNSNKAINILSAALVLFLATAAFILSYSALRELAIDNGLSEGLAILWPLILDGFMICASLAVLRANLAKESKWYQWLLVGSFSLLSVAFNVAHAPANLLAQVIYALPPLVVFLAFELLMKQSAATAKRNTTLKSIAELTAEAATLTDSVTGLTASITDMTGKRDGLKAELVEMRKEKKAATTSGKNGAPATTGNETRERAMAILAERSDISGAALGRELGKSDSLGRQLKRELLPQPATSGNGVEVAG